MAQCSTSTRSLTEQAAPIFPERLTQSLATFLTQPCRMVQSCSMTGSLRMSKAIPSE